MADYRVFFKPSARRELARLPPDEVGRIFPRIRSLAAESRPPGCRKLRQSHDLWRIRIGDYRVVYAVDDDERVIRIMAVRHRRDSYR